MSYQNDIIFAVGYGGVCIFVLCIFIIILFFACLAAAQLNEFLLKIGKASRNAYALRVFNRINRRKRYRKTGESPARFI